MKTLKTVAFLTLALAAAGPALAKETTRNHRHVAMHHASRHAGHTLTVRRLATPVPLVRAYDPFTGIGTLVTGPVAIASNIVGGIFNVGNSIFPADPRSPTAIVGAPIRLAGEIAQIPFRIVQAPFRIATGHPAF